MCIQSNTVKHFQPRSSKKHTSITDVNEESQNTSPLVRTETSLSTLWLPSMTKTLNSGQWLTDRFDQFVQMNVGVSCVCTLLVERVVACQRLIRSDWLAGLKTSAVIANEFFFLVFFVCFVRGSGFSQNGKGLVLSLIIDTITVTFVLKGFARWKLGVGTFWWHVGMSSKIMEVSSSRHCFLDVRSHIEEKKTTKENMQGNVTIILSVCWLAGKITQWIISRTILS